MGKAGRDWGAMRLLVWSGSAMAQLPDQYYRVVRGVLAFGPHAGGRLVRKGFQALTGGGLRVDNAANESLSICRVHARHIVHVAHG